jgi:hypothetical protein
VNLLLDANSNNEYLREVNLAERLELSNSGESGVLLYSEISISLTVSGEGRLLKFILAEEDLDINVNATKIKIAISNISSKLTPIFFNKLFLIYHPKSKITYSPIHINNTT